MAANTNTIPKPVLADIKSGLNASDVCIESTLQELWSGYGYIVRLRIAGAPVNTAILKLINPPQQTQHPRGWNTSDSHQRKLRSYQVESHWYEHLAQQCNDSCKVPEVIKAGRTATYQWILMEDLSERYPRLASSLSVSQAKVCLGWLAAFHARFFQCKPDGLWSVGTYWHLDTRHEEWQSMPPGPLKTHAAELDKKLSGCGYQTLVHGDAKVANFCFTKTMDHVAAVDFQYVGGGVGIKDVAYFLGSCLDEDAIEQYESELLSHYFRTLHALISATHGSETAGLVQAEWSALYAIAWTDFYRFLEGWMPGHKKINRYTRLLANQVFEQLIE